MTIVTTTYRPKRPPRKRKAVAIKAAIATRGPRRKPAPDIPVPANDDPPSKPAPAATKPAIVTTSISRKRARLTRAEPAELPDDPEADAAMRAWLERAKWGHGPAR